MSGEEKLLFEKPCTARVFKGRVTTADMIGQREKVIGLFSEIVDRAYGSS